LYRQKPASRFDSIFPPPFTPLLAPEYSLPLQHWCATIEYEDRLDAKIQELAYSTKEPDDVGVAKSIALFVADCF
jgi:hypothetical protein